MVSMIWGCWRAPALIPAPIWEGFVSDYECKMEERAAYSWIGVPVRIAVFRALDQLIGIGDGCAIRALPLYRSARTKIDFRAQGVVNLDPLKIILV